MARQNVSEARELSALLANFPVGAPITLTRGDATRERGFTCVDPGYRNRIRIGVPCRKEDRNVSLDLSLSLSSSLSQFLLSCLVKSSWNSPGFSVLIPWRAENGSHRSDRVGNSALKDSSMDRGETSSTFTNASIREIDSADCRVGLELRDASYLSTSAFLIEFP